MSKAIQSSNETKSNLKYEDHVLSKAIQSSNETKSNSKYEDNVLLKAILSSNETKSNSKYDDNLPCSETMQIDQIESLTPETQLSNDVSTTSYNANINEDMEVFFSDDESEFLEHISELSKAEKVTIIPPQYIAKKTQIEMEEKTSQNTQINSNKCKNVKFVDKTKDNENTQINYQSEKNLSLESFKPNETFQGVFSERDISLIEEILQSTSGKSIQ